jgi:hypothetical protein
VLDPTIQIQFLEGNKIIILNAVAKLTRKQGSFRTREKMGQELETLKREKTKNRTVFMGRSNIGRGHSTFDGQKLLIKKPNRMRVMGKGEGREGIETLKIERS